MNNLNISEDKLNSLLSMAGKKLGQSPEELKAQLQQGKLDGVLKNLDPSAVSKINGLVNNPAAMEAFMNNDKIQNMLSGLMNNKK